MCGRPRGSRQKRASSPTQAEAVLKPRPVIANGEFDQYWRYHLRKEHERVHHGRYRESLVLAA